MPKRPNILLLYTDQQRADTIHAAGHPVIRTPVLDRLCGEGVRFSSCYTVSPVCVSARCSLAIGQYPQHTGCYDNGFPMPTDRPTLMSLLTEAGYRTHGVGKMHFTPERDALMGFQTRLWLLPELAPGPDGDDYLMWLREQGFEHAMPDPHGCRGEMYYVPQPSQLPERAHATTWVADRAIDFLRERDRSRPFFLWASFIHPHPPFSPPVPWNKLYRAPLMPLPRMPQGYESLWTYYNRWQNRYKYRDQGTDLNLVRCIIAYYYACVSFVDFNMGRILKVLDEGELDDTLVVQTTDHGEFLGDYGCFGKRSFLDPAARIPLIVRLPGRFARGEVCDGVCSTVDVTACVLAAARVEAPAGHLDGLDLADLARGEARREMVFGQMQQGAGAIYMAVSSDWKYTYSAPDGREFLFDRLGRRPGETRNRAGVPFCGEALERMRRAMISFLKETGEEAALVESSTGDSWRRYPKRSMPPDPDAELLVQDSAWAEPLYRIPGYTGPESGTEAKNEG